MTNHPPDTSADAQRIGEIRELLSGGHSFIALRRDQIQWLLQRVEQAEAQRAKDAFDLGAMNEIMLASERRAEQAEAQHDRWYRVVDLAWTAADQTALAEPDESLPRAVTKLRERAEAAEEGIASARQSIVRLTSSLTEATELLQQSGFSTFEMTSALADARQEVENNGVSLIAAERKRQRLAEGWSEAHDDAHDLGEMAVAAICYALEDVAFAATDARRSLALLWTWSSCWWKPKDPIRNLTRAGALIAAELDRRLRAMPKCDGLMYSCLLPSGHDGECGPPRRSTLSADLAAARSGPLLVGNVLAPCAECVSERGKVDPRCNVCGGSGICPSSYGPLAAARLRGREEREPRQEDPIWLLANRVAVALETIQNCSSIEAASRFADSAKWLTAEIRGRVARLENDHETLIAARDAAETLFLESKREVARLSSQLAEAHQQRGRVVKELMHLLGDVGLQDADATITRLSAQAVEISTALSDAGCNAMPIAQAVRQVISERDRLSSQLAGMREALVNVRAMVIGEHGASAWENVNGDMADAALHAAHGSPTLVRCLCAFPGDTPTCPIDHDQIQHEAGSPTPCTCGSADPQSARYQQPHLTWCGARDGSPTKDEGPNG